MQCTTSASAVTVETKHPGSPVSFVSFFRHFAGTYTHRSACAHENKTHGQQSTQSQPSQRSKLPGRLAVPWCVWPSRLLVLLLLPLLLLLLLLQPTCWSHTPPAWNACLRGRAQRGRPTRTGTDTESRRRRLADQRPVSGFPAGKSGKLRATTGSPTTKQQTKHTAVRRLETSWTHSSAALHNPIAIPV